MKRILLFGFVLALFLASTFFSGASAKVVDGGETLFRIEIRNRTEGAVYLTLIGINNHAVYRLVVPAKTEQAFSVKADTYTQITFSCNVAATGTLDVSRQLRLTFTACATAAPNAGAPSSEKIHLNDTPLGIAWYYQYSNPLLSGPVSGDGRNFRWILPVHRQCGRDDLLRPATTADVFSEQGAGFTTPIGARTSDGWLGFDPGVAQAANIGSFRLRWLAPGSGTLSGGCARLPVVWGPRPGICYFMPMETTSVRAAPDVSSSEVAVLHLGEFAQVSGLAPGEDWAKVRFGTGEHRVACRRLGTVQQLERQRAVRRPADHQPLTEPFTVTFTVKGDRMNKVIAQERFAQDLFDILEETFETHHGIFLDRGTSLFQTLAGITAAEASRPVGISAPRWQRRLPTSFSTWKCSNATSLPATAARRIGARSGAPSKASPRRNGMRSASSCARPTSAFSPCCMAEDAWDNENAIGGALAIVVHSAYHLGEIRQALCTLQ